MCFFNDREPRNAQNPEEVALPIHEQRDLNRPLTLENYFLEGELEAAFAAFIDHYNNHRYHESIGNLTPADVHFGRGETILAERKRIKLKTIQNRHLHHKRQAA